MYKGLVVPEMLPNVEEVSANLRAVPPVELLSWRQAAPFGAYLWTVKPPGSWVVMMRLDEYVVTSDFNVPLRYDMGLDVATVEVRWDKIYTMLGRHKTALLCRLDPSSGLIAVASAKPDSPWLPLMPGYMAVVEGPLPFDFDSATKEDIEKLAREGYEWPEGLQEPAIIHMSSIHDLSIAERREEWLRKYPEGMWLLSVQQGKMAIFEILS